MNWQRLAEIIGEEQVVAPEQNDRYQLIGLPPLPVAYPQNIEQLSEILRFANSEQLAVFPVGGATKLEIGNVPRRASFFISMVKMNSVLAHPAADLTVTAQAGCRLADLQTAIDAHGQFLPIDAPYCQMATIGGIVAANSYGPLRLSYGTVRDWLIGIKVVTVDGAITKAGGNVVKNVAGYDLMKLYTGSFGTLAVIAEMNFKLRPRPIADSTMISHFNELEPAQKAARQLLNSQFLPTSLEFLTKKAAKFAFPQHDLNRDYLLAARFSGTAEAVEHQCRRIIELWQLSAKDLYRVPTNSPECWTRLSDYPQHYAHLLALRATVPPARLFELIDESRNQLHPLTDDYQLLAHVGNGVLRILVNSRDGEIKPNLRPRWRVLVESLRAFAVQAGGSCVMERAPLSLHELVDSWGEVRSAAPLMRSIKNRLDPIGILSPGRFVAGI